MYIPADFNEPDVAQAHALIAANSFGMLIVPRGEGAPEIAHIPFLLDADPAPLGTLRAHVARANPMGACFMTDVSIVAVFSGAHAYITPRWLASPHENVPTWNYAALRARLGVLDGTGRGDHGIAAPREIGLLQAGDASAESSASADVRGDSTPCRTLLEAGPMYVWQ
jgi:hypothetical protein